MRSRPLPPDPDRVLITEHAIHRYLLRYPADVLPVRPEREIRALLRRANPMDPRRARTWQKTLMPSTLYHACKWIFPLVPSRNPNYDWVLPTVLRAERHTNNATPFLRNRLANWRAFRSGEADQLLVALARELGTTDVHELRRGWHARRYPLVQHGGYPSFDEYHRSRLKLLRTALQEPCPAEPASTPTG